jgi:hypothetical protein
VLLLAGCGAQAQQQQAVTKHEYEARLRAALRALATPPVIEEHTISDGYTGAADERATACRRSSASRVPGRPDPATLGGLSRWWRNW